MPFRRCLTCGELTRLGSRCEDCSGQASWNGTRDRGAQARFRREVLKRDGNQCRALNDEGTRCPARSDLQAHHTAPGSWDPADGVTLCRAHHRAVDKHAR